MIRIFSFLVLLISSTTYTLAQNLIQNASAEEFLECPETLEGIENNVEPWMKLRGTPDYFNACSQNELLGWDNAVGFQIPRTGNGYFGAITYSKNVVNEREIIGVPLSEPMVIGETYHITFYTSLAIKNSGGSRYASSNIGCLFMTNNYLGDNPGPAINFSHYNFSVPQLDTASWTQHTFKFIADSAYTMVGFGNFYNDDNTITENFYPDEDSGYSFYYFDDFCVTTNPDGCKLTNTNEVSNDHRLIIYPNPVKDFIYVECSHKISRIQIFDSRGVSLENRSIPQTINLKIDVSEGFTNGIYYLKLTTDKRSTTKQIILKN